MKKTILVTGGTGFIGSQLVSRLAERHQVISLARSKQKAANGVIGIKGCFHSFEDLRQLDGHRIDALIHLAAVTGGCSEADGIEVNVAGTRRLVRYLVDRGCRKFVLASSIAAVGCLTDSEPRFIPLQLPMPPDHPFIGRDAYGLSKATMEEWARYFARRTPGADFVSLRFGAVTDEKSYAPEPAPAGSLPLWGFVTLARVALADVLRCLQLTVEAPEKAGYRQYNLVGPDTCCDDSVPDLMRVIGGQLDLSSYRQSGHEYDPVYSMEEIRRDLGFIPEIPMRREAFLRWKQSPGKAP